MLDLDPDFFVHLGDIVYDRKARAGMDADSELAAFIGIVGTVAMT